MRVIGPVVHWARRGVYVGLPIASLLALLMLGAGCPGSSSTNAAVALSNTWPEEPGDYRNVTASWTRRGVLRSYDAQVLEVFATFKSPAWRAARVRHLTRVQQLSPKARDELAARERQADEAFYEVQLLVTTWDRQENDLTKGERSVWRVVLADSEGNEVAPAEIERDRRPRDVIRAEFPALNDFAIPYVARFPRDVALLGPEAQAVWLRMFSPRGAVELVWQNR